MRTFCLKQPEYEIKGWRDYKIFEFLVHMENRTSFHTLIPVYMNFNLQGDFIFGL